MTARSCSTAYYADKQHLLARMFGDEVRVTETAIEVGDASYPVVDDVIITLSNDQMPAGLSERTLVGAEFAADVQSSFGDQWQRYDEVTEEHRREFAQYFDLVDLASLRECAVADLGCGSGRYAACVASHCQDLVLVDFSDAIFVARRNLTASTHAAFVMGDVLDLPFRPAAFDFAYSLGVLHHLPVPALVALRRLRRLSPRFLVYLYYALDNRPFYFRALLGIADRLRRVLSKVRSRPVRELAVWAITILAYWPLATIGRMLAPLGLDRLVPLAEFYRGKSFRRLRQDAHDRFLTAIEQRFSQRDINTLADKEWAVTLSDGLPYWHFCYERRSDSPGAIAASTSPTDPSTSSQET